MKILRFLQLRKLASSPGRLLILLVILGVGVFCENYFARTPSFSATVQKVIDGDTVDVLNARGQKIRIRLDGIDAPESRQRFGPESRRALAALIEGKRVSIYPKGKDKYERTLATIKLAGKDINRLMVAWGWAWANSYYSHIYDEDQARARAKRYGLWQDKKPMEPYKWRKKYADKMRPGK